MINKLQSYKKTALRTLRRSLSSPTLSLKPKNSSSGDSSVGDVELCKLSLDDSRMHMSSDELDISMSAMSPLSHSGGGGRIHRSMDELHRSKTQGSSSSSSSSETGDKFNYDIDEFRNKHKSLDLSEIDMWFPDTEMKGVNNEGFIDQSMCLNIESLVAPVIRKSLYPCARKVVVKEPLPVLEAAATGTVRTPVIFKRDCLSRGTTPLVNHALTLENMRKIHERNISQAKGASVVGACEKENIVSVFYAEKIVSNLPTASSQEKTKLVVERMSDITNVNLEMLGHISLDDSPRSAAKRESDCANTEVNKDSSSGSNCTSSNVDRKYETLEDNHLSNDVNLSNKKPFIT